MNSSLNDDERDNKNRTPRIQVRLKEISRLESRETHVLVKEKGNEVKLPFLITLKFKRKKKISFTSFSYFSNGK